MQPASLSALGVIPFQVNPHYPAAGPLRTARDRRLGEFLEENDVPVLGLCEGSWLHVSAARATAGGTAGGRVLTRGSFPATSSPAMTSPPSSAAAVADVLSAAHGDSSIRRIQRDESA
ncbi:Type 1 glutamine amidotransferase-like domain-containing protein [Trebonia kvetii]|uniref:Type 1 glutamine amidotransferase-like domain-containing protein n=1 Tax=Trebonia kvetii TaxID=2480626 RepID=UPI001FE65FFF|nr:Type 1 glutamine amidotransferase-like domain-containing protein [Trebonia kvetii]